MKKRFFLTMVFLVLLSSIFIGIEKEEKYYNTRHIETEIIEKIMRLDQGEAIKEEIPVFIVPIIFFFVACLFASVQHAEFEIGTVVWKPKYRKLLPRGNLV